MIRPGTQIAVIGDIMLDHFVIGRVDRISPEAPVPVVRFERDAYRLGGAANVAANVRALQGHPILVGTVGDDDAARELERLLTAQEISAEGLVRDAGRPTTRKLRVVTTRNQQVARVDYEDESPVAGAALDALCASVRSACGNAGAIVLSDYRKGVVNAPVIAAAREAAQGKPLVVDPKVPDAARYAGVSVLTPNHHEAELMTGLRIREADDARMAARKLHDATGANILITWGEHGMWIFDAAGGGHDSHIAATAREVADVTGAGDTVVATLALALAAGATLAEAATFANQAAGVVVGKFGAATASLEELGLQAGPVPAR